MSETVSGGALAEEASHPMPAPPGAGDGPPAQGRGVAGALLDQAPYIAMLAASFVGVAYAGLSATPSPLYWKIVTPVFGLLCIAAGWAGAPARGGRMRLVWTQALH